MAWFGQGKDTIEWNEFRSDVLFYKWGGNELKKGSKLIIRPGQKAIFFANGNIEGIFESPGTYDVISQIVPFLSTLKGWFELRGDTGMRAEIYFVNTKQMLIQWGTKQRIMLPSPDVPTGIPVGCNGNLVLTIDDYLNFIINIAGVKDSYSVDEISERIMGEINPIIAECMLKGERSIGINALIELQMNSRALGKKIAEELDLELKEFGFKVIDININSINYPKELQEMAEKVAAHSFVGDVGKYASMQMADSFENGGANNVAGMGMQMAMGAQMAQQFTQQQPVPQQQPIPQQQPVQPAPAPIPQEPQAPAGDRFCPTCRKMVSGKFCSECGTATV